MEAKGPTLATCTGLRCANNCTALLSRSSLYTSSQSAPSSGLALMGVAARAISLCRSFLAGPPHTGSDEPSCPAVKLTLHPVGGFCALCKVLPLPKDQQLIETESGTATVAGNGMNAQFGETVHCMAAEPQAVFLRVCVVDRGQEVAYETSCLGRLRVGYRVLNLRSMLGTRIELCHLLVCISFRHEPFSWATARQLRIQNAMEGAEFPSRVPPALCQKEGKRTAVSVV